MKRILCAIPIPYGPEWGFWTRDSGLVVLALREMGYDSWLVALGGPATVASDWPILPITLETMQSADWWRAQQPDAIILNTWSASRYDAIREAALSATPRVVERLDTDGVRSARLFPGAHFVRSCGGYLDTLPPGARWSAPFRAAFRTAVLYLFPGLMDVRMVASMRQLPALIAESPIAAERMQRMIETFSGVQHRIKVIPHPVNENTIRYTGCPKENRIISVGRWDVFQKDFPLLRKVLEGFLRRHPEWEATIVGKGVSAGGPAPADLERRIRYHEKMTHEQLAVEYSRSKIYLMVSRYESFCIAAAEALCCGCSVVGSCDVPSSYYFAENQSGRVAEKRNENVFLTTLDREVESWTKGERNPETIASFSRKRMGSHAVAEATLALLEEIPAGSIHPEGEPAS